MMLIWTIWNHFRLYGTLFIILDNLGKIIWDQFRRFKFHYHVEHEVICYHFDLSGPLGTIPDHLFNLTPFETISNHSDPFGPFWTTLLYLNCFLTIMTIWDYLDYVGPFSSFWTNLDHFGPIWTIWNHLSIMFVIFQHHPSPPQNTLMVFNAH